MSGAPGEGSRAILFDPVCGTRRGHNFATLIKYADWIRAHTALAPELWIADFDGDLAGAPHPVKTCIPWVFEYFIPTGNRGFWPWLGRRVRHLAQHGRPRRLARLLAAGLAVLLFLNSRRQVEAALRRALDLRPRMLFLPGADQYSLAALAQILERHPEHREVPIHIRLMGVMEHESHLRVTREVHVPYLKTIVACGHQVRLSCETEKYAAAIGGQLGIEVPVTHIPVHPAMATRRGHAPVGTRAPLVMACVGGARGDKGYFHLVFIANQLRLHAGVPLVLRVQRMAAGNAEFNPDYEFALMRCPNIELLPAFLSDEALQQEIADADVILLPYSVDTYRMRGSAILFDTLPYGKPLLGRRGTAFGDTIDSHGFGFTFADHQDLLRAARAIQAFSAEALAALRQREQDYLRSMETRLLEALTHEA